MLRRRATSGPIVTFAVSSVTAPPAGMASRALTTRLRTIWNILSGVRVDGPQFVSWPGFEHDAVAHQPLQTRASTLDDIVQVQDGLLQVLLFAAEHDELTRQVGRQFRRVTNRLHLGRAANSRAPGSPTTPRCGRRWPPARC